MSSNKFVVHGLVHDGKTVNEGRQPVRKATPEESPLFWSVYSVDELGREHAVPDCDFFKEQEAIAAKKALEENCV